MLKLFVTGILVPTKQMSVCDLTSCNEVVFCSSEDLVALHSVL